MFFKQLIFFKKLAIKKLAHSLLGLAYESKV